MEDHEWLKERRGFDAMVADWGETSIRSLLMELARLDKPFARKLLRGYNLQTISLLELFGFEKSEHKKGMAAKGEEATRRQVEVSLS